MQMEALVAKCLSLKIPLLVAWITIKGRAHLTWVRFRIYCSQKTRRIRDPLFLLEDVLTVIGQGVRKTIGEQHWASLVRHGRNFSAWMLRRQWIREKIHEESRLQRAKRLAVLNDPENEPLAYSAGVYNIELPTALAEHQKFVEAFKRGRLDAALSGSIVCWSKKAA